MPRSNTNPATEGSTQAHRKSDGLEGEPPRPRTPTRLVPRHQFSSKIKAKLREICKYDNYHAILALVEDYAVFGLAIALPYFVGSLFQSWAWWIAYACISVPLIGCRQRALATLLHESAHRTLAKSRVWNFIAGTFFSGYLVMQGWCAYKKSHVDQHHPLLGTEEDPDLSFLRKQGVYEARSSLDFALRFLIAPLFFLRTPSKIIDLFRYRFFSPAEPIAEKLLKAAYLSGLVFTFYWFGGLTELFLFWLVPYLTIFPICNWYIELAEHTPLRPDAKSDLYTARNRWTGRLGRFLTGVHNESYHLAHHLHPGIPFWRLPEAHLIMMDDPEYRAVQSHAIGWMLPLVNGVPSILGWLARSTPSNAGHKTKSGLEVFIG